MRRFVTAFAAAGLVWVLAAAAAAAGASLTVSGLGGRSVTLDAAAIAALPHQTAMLAGEKGPSKAMSGPSLASLLAQVGAPAGAALRGPATALVVEVRAADGYRSVLSLAEADPGMRGEAVILADRAADGSALAANEAPFRLVVSGDRRPARSVRMVSSIRILPVPAD